MATNIQNIIENVEELTAKATSVIEIVSNIRKAFRKHSIFLPSDNVVNWPTILQNEAEIDPDIRCHITMYLDSGNKYGHSTNSSLARYLIDNNVKVNSISLAGGVGLVDLDRITMLNRYSTEKPYQNLSKIDIDAETVKGHLSGSYGLGYIPATEVKLSFDECRDSSISYMPDCEKISVTGRQGDVSIWQCPQVTSITAGTEIGEGGLPTPRLHITDCPKLADINITTKMRLDIGTYDNPYTGTLNLYGNEYSTSALGSLYLDGASIKMWPSAKKQEMLSSSNTRLGTCYPDPSWYGENKNAPSGLRQILRLAPPPYIEYAEGSIYLDKGDQEFEWTVAQIMHTAKICGGEDEILEELESACISITPIEEHYYNNQEEVPKDYKVKITVHCKTTTETKSYTVKKLVGYETVVLEPEQTITCEVAKYTSEGQPYGFTIKEFDENGLPIYETVTRVIPAKVTQKPIYKYETHYSIETHHSYEGVSISDEYLSMSEKFANGLIEKFTARVQVDVNVGNRRDAQVWTRIWGWRV